MIVTVQEETQLSTDTSVVKQAAQTVMDEINRSLQPVAELCLPVSLDFVESAERLSANKKVGPTAISHFRRKNDSRYKTTTDGITLSSLGIPTSRTL